MRPVDSTELARGGCKMLFDSALRDVQYLADFPGRLALRGPADRLALARGEAGRGSPCRSEQTTNVIETVHRDQVQRRLAPGIEIEMDAGKRDTRLIAGQAVNWHDEAARHAKVGCPPHHLDRTKLEFCVVRGFRPFEGIHGVPAHAEYG